jgi:hypothetical protein
MVAALTKDFDPYASGVLDPQHHDRLVANIDQVAIRAGLGVLHRHLIWTSAELSKAEMQIVENAILMARHSAPWTAPKLGLCYTKDQHTAEQKMLAIAGLLVRNFVDARVMSRMDVVAERKDSKQPVDGTMVLVPDFALPEYIETMPAWERTAMMEFIHERIREGLPTCVFVGVSMTSLRDKLPSVYADLKDAYKIEE